MRLLVTGHKGFVASFLLPRLEAAGHEIVGYDMRDGQDMHDVPALQEAMRGCDGVVHLAAIPHYYEDSPPGDYLWVNWMGTRCVYEAFAASRATHLVVTSSGAFYGFGRSLPGQSEARNTGWAKAPLRETDWPQTWEDWRQLDIYGLSKMLARMELAPLPKRNITVLRLNCIEPEHKAARDGGWHWGWWCSHDLIGRCYNAALARTTGGVQVVNVHEPNPNLDPAQQERLLGGVL